MQSAQNTRKFGCVAMFGVLLLGLAWGFFSFVAPPVVNFPKTVLPEPNAFATHLQATQAHSTNTDAVNKIFGVKANTPLPFEQKLQHYRAHEAQIEAWLKQNANARQLFRRGLTQEYREPPVRGVAKLPQHHSDFREMARILVVESNSRAARGDWKGATRSALDVVHFGHDIPHGANLIGALIGYATQAIGRRQIEELLPYLDAATCRATAREIEKLRANRLPFAEVLQEEKWNVASNLLPMLQGVQGLGMQFTAYNAATKKTTFRPVSRRRVMGDSLAYMDALSAAAKVPYTKSVAPTPPPHFFTGTLAPVFSRARFNDARADAAGAMLMLGLALRAYRLEHGAYPENLAQLMPQYISQVPADGFGGGEALRYKKSGDKYRLWSIGPDKTDDGGKEVNNPDKPANSGRFLVREESKGDFVFGVSR